MLTQVVQAATTTALSSDHNPSNPGQTVTFTAYVTVTPPGSGTPTGKVTFYDGSTAMGTVALDGTGHAAYATAALIRRVTQHHRELRRGRELCRQHLDRAHPGRQQDRHDDRAELSLNPSNLGQTVTFTATVTGSSGAPTGNVTFYDGSTAMGTVALDGTGHAAYATSSTTGSHSITASYGGEGNFAGSTSPVLTQQVNGGCLPPRFLPRR